MKKLIEKGRYYIFIETNKKTTRIREEKVPTKGKTRFSTIALK